MGATSTSLSTVALAGLMRQRQHCQIVLHCRSVKQLAEFRLPPSLRLILHHRRLLTVLRRIALGVAVAILLLYIHTSIHRGWSTRRANLTKQKRSTVMRSMFA